MPDQLNLADGNRHQFLVPKPCVGKVVSCKQKDFRGRIKDSLYGLFTHWLVEPRLLLGWYGLYWESDSCLILA